MNVLAGADFFTVEVLTWRGPVTYCVLFFIHLVAVGGGRCEDDSASGPEARISMPLPNVGFDLSSKSACRR